MLLKAPRRRAFSRGWRRISHERNVRAQVCSCARSHAGLSAGRHPALVSAALNAMVGETWGSSLRMKSPRRPIAYRYRTAHCITLDERNSHNGGDQRHLPCPKATLCVIDIGMPHTKQRARDAGFDAYPVKPASPAALARALEPD